MQTNKHSVLKYINKLEANNKELMEALQKILVHSDRIMAKGSRDFFDWQDDNRWIGDKARAAIKKAKNVR